MKETQTALKSGRFIPGAGARPDASNLDADWFWSESHASLVKARAQLEMAARSHVNVLIVGETGTGKELVARALYERRRRHFRWTEREAPFVAANCGALPEALAESLLFGHERGAFTSARERQTGKFEAAGRGTLFLDEIQSLPAPIQVKLLRVVQHREFESLGAQRKREVECQIVTASNLPLELLVERGTFRQDLYYRLNVCPIYLPPLRERRAELERICEGLLRGLGYGGRRRLSDETRELFAGYAWPGNLRQLEHALLYAALRTDREIRREHLPAFLTGELEAYLASGDWR